MNYGIPLGVYWAVGAIAAVLGLATIVAGERFIRCLRWWLLKQLRWARGARYLRLLKLQGWLLFVLGTLMLVLLAWRR